MKTAHSAAAKVNPELPENGSHISIPKNVFPAETLLETSFTKRVELTTFLRVGQDRICLVDLFELFFRLLVTLVLVRMVLKG